MRSFYRKRRPIVNMLKRLSGPIENVINVEWHPTQHYGYVGYFCISSKFCFT
jgi:hypothetical protein